MSAEDTRAQVQRQLFLRTMSIARPAPGSTATLLNAMKDGFFAAGATLYRQGDAPDSVYFVVTGSVELVASGEAPMRFDERSAVGVLDMLQDRPHARTAVALTDVHVLIIRSEDWLEMLEDNFDSARGAIIGISTNGMAVGKGLGSGGGFEEPPGPPGPTPERPLNLVERLLVLRDLPAFRATRIQALTSLAEIADEERLAEGEVLFQEKQPQTAIHLLAHGSVRIASEVPPISAVFGPRSLVGGYTAFAPVAGYTAFARSASVLLRIGREDLFDVMEDHFEVARSVLAFLATERARLGARKATLSMPPPSVPLPVDT